MNCKNEATKKFVDLMLGYVIENNFDNLDLTNETLPDKYAVLIALSFSVVIKTEYMFESKVENEICRVKINKDTTKESLKKDFMSEMGF